MAVAVVLSPLSSYGFWPPLLALIGAAAGVFLFFRGFRMLQYKRLILNTPFSKIRSASIGLVEINGTPIGPQTLSAPITGESCYYYRARAWQWKDSGKSGSWHLVVDEGSFVPFFLEDSTGKVLINPQGADLDVHRSFKDEVSASMFRKGSPIPQNIQDFVLWRGIVPTDRIRLEEQIIRPGYPLFVFGTLGENRDVTSWAPQPHSLSSGVSFDFDPENPLSMRVSYRPSGKADLSGAIKNVLGRIPGDQAQRFRVVRVAGDPLVLPDRAVQMLNRAGVTLPVPVTRESAAVQSAVSGRTDSGAVVLVAKRDGAATSALAEAPRTATMVQEPGGDSDLHEHVAIGKDERNDPFTISSHSQREIVQSLAWQSTACIWGGPVLTLTCLYFLWFFWTWF